LLEKVSVIVVDDHAIFRRGVAETLGRDQQLNIVGEGASRDEALELVGRLNPDIALIDLSMPGGGIQATREIHARYPNVKIVVLTVSEEHDDVMQALQAGASGYVLKGISAEELLMVVRSIWAGEPYVAPRLGFRLLSGMQSSHEEAKVESGMEILTPKERQILELVGLGLNNEEIAQKAGIQIKTVKFHVSNLLDKLKLRNRVQLALFAQRNDSNPSGTPGD
jgi:two-component system, NarL family, nitrate/nitrite response regulator NarL